MFRIEKPSEVILRRPVIARKERKRRFGFIGDSISELRKVVWPPRREAARLTGIVIIVCVAVGLILGITDYGFSKLMQVILP